MKITFFSLIFMAASIHAQVLSLEEAIEIGLQQNFNILIARNNAEIADNSRGLGTAGFLPTLDATGNLDYSKSDQETNSPFSFGSTETENLAGSINLNWTLFDGFKMFVDKKRFDDLAELGEYQSRNLIETSVVGIMQTYFNLVQQEQLLDVVNSTMEISRTRLEKEEIRNQIGGASSTDLLNARVSYNNDRSTFLNQELRVKIAKNDLNILLGRDPNTTFEVDKDIIIPLIDLEYSDILELARKQNSALNVFRQDKLVADRNVKIAASPFYPRLQLGGAYSKSDRTISREGGDDIITESDDLRAGLTLTLNLFNGFRNNIDWQNARIQARNKELALKDGENQLAGLVSEKYQTFLQRMELVKIEEENVVSAQQNLDRQQERYSIGTATSLEFRDAQVNLARTQAALINARYQARISRLEIDQLTGNLVVK